MPNKGKISNNRFSALWCAVSTNNIREPVFLAVVFGEWLADCDLLDLQIRMCDAYYLWDALKNRVYVKNTHYLARTKRIFEEKLQRLRDNISVVVCRKKIFVEVPRFVYKLEFRTLRIFHEIKQVELHRKNGL
jgi:hypothetical protein